MCNAPFLTLALNRGEGLGPHRDHITPVCIELEAGWTPESGLHVFEKRKKSVAPTRSQTMYHPDQSLVQWFSLLSMWPQRELPHVSKEVQENDRKLGGHSNF